MTLLTDKSKTLVRKFNCSLDSQTILSELHTHALLSTHAKIEVASLLSYIKSVRFGYVSRKVLVLSLVVQWLDQIGIGRRPETSSKPLFQWCTKLMLENAVHNIAELSNPSKWLHNLELSFAQCIELLCHQEHNMMNILLTSQLTVLPRQINFLMKRTPPRIKKRATPILILTLELKL